MKFLLILVLLGVAGSHGFSLKSLFKKEMTNREITELPADCATLAAETAESASEAISSVIPAGLLEAVADAMPDDPRELVRCVPNLILGYRLRILKTVVLADEAFDWTGMEMLKCYAIASKLGIEAELQARGGSPGVPPPPYDLPDDCPTPPLRRGDRVEYRPCICEPLVDVAVQVLADFFETTVDPTFDWKLTTTEALAPLETPPLCAAKMIAGTFIAEALGLATIVEANTDQDTCDAVGLIPHSICYAGFIIKEIDELVGDDTCPLLPPIVTGDRPRPPFPRPSKRTMDDTTTERITELLSRFMKQ